MILILTDEWRKDEGEEGWGECWKKGEGRVAEMKGGGVKRS